MFMTMESVSHDLRQFDRWPLINAADFKMKVRCGILMFVINTAIIIALWIPLSSKGYRLLTGAMFRLHN